MRMVGLGQNRITISAKRTGSSESNQEAFQETETPPQSGCFNGTRKPWRLEANRQREEGQHSLDDGTVIHCKAATKAVSRRWEADFRRGEERHSRLDDGTVIAGSVAQQRPEQKGGGRKSIDNKRECETLASTAEVPRRYPIQVPGRTGRPEGYSAEDRSSVGGAITVCGMQGVAAVCVPPCKGTR
ncbi:uncharacterized protein LOC134217316 [Armigeres subalbatus]|uniref:uncharacterized protein LOC134217316 n=1 Tax=Armigeres subalbatus TaxID=124917 RepID=UPI002ED16E99